MEETNDQTVRSQMWAGDRAAHATGMSVDEAGLGRSLVSMTVRTDMVNGLDVCHGGYVFLLADSAMAYATNSDDVRALAAAAQIDFTSAARLGDRLEARALSAWSGGRTTLVDVEVTNQTGQLIARFRGRTSRVSSPAPSQSQSE